MAQNGELQAWEKLDQLERERVAERSSVEYDSRKDTFSFRSYGQPVEINLKERRVSSSTERGSFLLEELSSYSQLGILYYLSEAKDILPTGNLVSPKELPGGDIFQRGTHRLPLHMITRRFGENGAAFLQAGRDLGGEQCECGDAGFTVFPFPRVPVTAALWVGSDEFPAEASILFDSTCPLHLATDVIWATAMMTIGMILLEAPE